MQGYSGHTLKMVNKSGKWVYVQIHCLSQQGVAFLSQEKAGELAGSARDYATKDLFEAIDRGECPEWKCYVQGMHHYGARVSLLVYRDFKLIPPQ